jgi:hypothetical protein
VISATVFTLLAAVPRAGSGPLVAHLGTEAGAAAITRIRTAFRKRNPAYDLAYHQDATVIAPGDRTRVLFVQTGESSATVALEALPGKHPAFPPRSSELREGDVVVLRAHERLTSAAPLGLLAFTSPVTAPDELPTFVRPDFDPRITDTPGGCAEESDAYRRVLLTWEGRNGPYLYHALNAHRVRIRDSFTHYHPLEGGFDEFYLVQGAGPEGRLLTSVHTASICSPASVTAEMLPDLLHETRVTDGDLVYLPRGMIHRGLDDVLAQVITVPGFVPGAEIGVDHHLHAINQRLGLDGGAALPLHESGRENAVVK